MNVLDLFSGIGGFSLGLESAGMRTVAFCERDPYCQDVLRERWPNVPIHDDVCKLDGKPFAGTVDVICGGFPCQDISLAGKGAGLAGARSGLWFEYHRLIAEIRPRYAVIENVSALRSRGLDQVLGSLAAIGYDAEWHCIPASAIGAPHRRDRVWIVAYAESPECGGIGAFPNGAPDGFTNGSETLADAAGIRCDTRRPEPTRQCGELRASAQWIADARLQRDPWLVEPDVGRVAHGVPHRVDRLRALGNAIVPQIAALIGEAIMKYEAGTK